MLDEVHIEMQGNYVSHQSFLYHAGPRFFVHSSRVVHRGLVNAGTAKRVGSIESSLSDH